LSNPTGNVLTGIRFHVTTLCTSQSSNLTDMFLQCADVSQAAHSVVALLYFQDVSYKILHRLR